MAENQTQKIESSSSFSLLELVSESSLRNYWGILLLPALLATFLLMWLNTRFPGLSQWQEMLVQLGLFTTLSLRALRRYGRCAPEGLMVNGLAGLTVGLLLAIFRLVHESSFYLVFNLLAEPATTLMLGVLVAWGATKLIARVRIPQFLSH